jgi:hypothetical protein
MKKKEFQEIIVPENLPTRRRGAFTLAFIYSPQGNVLLKGRMRDVETYLQKNYKHKRYLIRYVLYKNGEHRDILHFSEVCNLSIRQPNIKMRDYHTRYEIYPYAYMSNKSAISLKLKRLPQKWIPEYDYLIDKYANV